MEIQTLEIKKHFVYAEHNYCAYIYSGSDNHAWFVIFDADEYGDAIDQPIYDYPVSSVTDEELNRCIQEFVNK